MQELYRDLWGWVPGNIALIAIHSYPKYFVFRENISLQNLNIEEKNGHDDNNIQVTKNVYLKKMTIKNIILEWLGFTHFK